MSVPPFAPAPLAASLQPPQEESYRTLFRQASDAMWVHDMDTGAMLDLNEAAVEFFGYSAEEQKAIGLAGLLAPESGCTMERAWEYARRAIAGEPQRFDWCGRRKDGTIVWHEVRQRRVTIGGVDRLLVTGRDVSDRRAAEAALRASEESYRTIFRHASDGMWVHDVDTGEVVDVNDAACEMLGYGRDELIALGLAGARADEPPYTLAQARYFVERAAAGEPQHFEWLARSRSGAPVWIEARMRRVTLAGEERVLLTGRDIGARKLAEDELRRSYAELERRVAERTAELAAANAALAEREEHFRRLIENASDMVLICDATGAITYIGPSVERLLGFTPAEMMGLRPSDNMHADDVPRVLEAIGYLLAHPGETSTTRYRTRHKDGSWRVHETVARTLSPTSGDAGIVANTRDITDRVEAERALGEREAHFRRLIEHASDFVMIVDASGAISYIAPAVERLLGYTPAEMLGQRPNDLVHPDDVPAVMATIGSLVERPDETFTIQFRMRHKNGRWRWIENVANAFVRGSLEGGLMANCRDITDRVEAERALRERDLHFRRMIEHASDHVMIVDESAAITYVAPSVERMLGWTPEEMLGTRPDDLVHPDDVPHVMGDFARIVAHPGEPHKSTFRIRHKDGGYRVFETHGRTMSPYGIEEGILAFGRDITERRAAEEALQRSEEHFRRLIENGSDIILVCDPEGCLTYVSPSMRRIMGYEPESLIGATPADLVHPDDVPALMASVARLVASPGSTEVISYRARHLDGSWRLIESVNRTVHLDGTTLAIVGNARDITEQRAAESALRRATEEAERAREEAERANRAKSDFLSRMSHELRTPMNSILGFGQLLARAELPPQQLKSVQHILKAGRHLLHLINEVLEIARIEAGRERLSLEPVALGSVLQEAFGLVRPLAQQWRVELREEAWPRAAFVHADRQRLVQVLLNLLSNAIKYNRPGGHVRLSCTAVGERWVVRVEDGGRGIPADQVPQLFTPFARLGAEQTDVEGTGLGLALSQRLCEAMGGALSLEGTGPDGSTFRVELAGAADPRRALEDTGAVPVVTAPHRDATLLYVEDNLANLTLVETILMSRPGWRTIPALQGRLGVELARECAPDVILLDLHLPDMHGDEVLRHLRADERTARIPVIVVSADATADSLERLRAAGADAYLTKPLDVDDFLAAVERFLPPRVH